MALMGMKKKPKTHTDNTNSLFTFVSVIVFLSSQFASDFPSGPDFQGALAIGNGSEDREDPWNAV